MLDLARNCLVLFLKLHVYILRFNDQLSHVSTTKVVYNMKDRLNWIKTLRTVFIAISSSIKPLRADKATHLLLVVIYIKSYFRYRFNYIWRKIHRQNTILVFEFVIFDTGFVFIKQALSKFMAGNRHNTEVPYQNYDKLKQTILMKRQRGKPELFIDPSFPPDLSSLTYVYIGDDRYERTKFARPLVGIICQMHVLCTCLMNFFYSFIT